MVSCFLVDAELEQGQKAQAGTKLHSSHDLAPADSDPSSLLTLRPSCKKESQAERTSSLY